MKQISCDKCNKKALEEIPLPKQSLSMRENELPEIIDLCVDCTYELKQVIYKWIGKKDYDKEAEVLKDGKRDKEKEYLFLIKKTWDWHSNETAIVQVIAENMDEAIERAYDLPVPKFTAWTFGNLPFGKIDGIWVEKYKKGLHHDKVLTSFEKNIDYPKKFWGQIIIWGILYVLFLSIVWIFKK